MPSCQAERFSRPGRRSLLQQASSQTPVSTQPPTTTPTPGSSEVSCKIRNISLGDPCSRGDGEKAYSSGNKSQECFQPEAHGRTALALGAQLRGSLGWLGMRLWRKGHALGWEDYGGTRGLAGHGCHGEMG
uniref:Uncharacterized protein n=1 Tax=Pipistrellus kuhlii TaxID=59472 RepID=A0A7J7V0D1_PIPKU|nr:hypothetical protein mPipKuh1_008615 [Pipistrellus kuhlii]